MKLRLLTIVMLIVISIARKKKGINFEAIDSAKTLNKLIRNRGTRVWQLLDDTKMIEERDKAARDPTYKWISEEKMIELPLICEINYKKKIYSIVMNATEATTAWITASGGTFTDCKSVFDKMPDLNDEQFAEFYKAFVLPKAQGEIKPNEKDTEGNVFLTEDDLADERGKANLRKSINFDLRGDKIKEVPWLSFWVYTCNKNYNQPPRSDYLSLNDQNDWNYEPIVPKEMQKYAIVDDKKKNARRLRKSKKIYFIQNKDEMMKIAQRQSIFKLARLMKAKKHRKHRKHRKE